jgi:hypothetical protein
MREEDPMPRISFEVTEPEWRAVRDIAEVRRNRGRASVAAVLRVALEKILADAKAGAD